jgi:hypothetical protein
LARLAAQQTAQQRIPKTEICAPKKFLARPSFGIQKFRKRSSLFAAAAGQTTHLFVLLVDFLIELI